MHVFEEAINITCGEGRYEISLRVQATADGLSGLLTGGEKPHVGGVAMSVPRMGQSGGKTLCDTWITPRPGHRDAELAARVSELICSDTHQTTAIVAGIHIGNAQKSEISILVENSLAAARLFVNKYKEITS